VPGRSEKDKMLAGEPYVATDPELSADRQHCDSVLREFNAEPDEDARFRLLEGLLGGIGAGAYVRPPLYCDYGYNIKLGADAYLNFGAVFLDCTAVTLGAHAQVGPGVQFLTADHPLEPRLRRADVEFAAPIAVGENAWIGGGAILCPGVTIGADTVVGAGSVVTRDLPAGVLAVGVPCRVLRSL
jgi:maltose O-acetyltransferase